MTYAQTAFLTFLFLFGTAYSGTVTLTGTCHSTLSSNYVNFTISNSGNDSATDMYVTPYLFGMGNGSAASASYAGLLGPGQNYSHSFYINSAPIHGTYAIGFITSYSQGGSAFSAAFPCLASFGAVEGSGISIGNIAQSKGDYLEATIYNNRSTAVNATVYAIAPYSLEILPKSISLSLNPGSYKNVSFEVNSSIPDGIGAFTLAIAAEYTVNGTHHATMSTYDMKAGSSVVQIGVGENRYLPEEIIGTIIIMLVALIITSLLKSKGAKKAKR
ncbi:MAG: hypothetical protein M1504_00960 [Candidatus Marsarchaeota archaeon]|nr:hypothetical protein [Candidatus Marsarchaeota archaeon]